MRWADVAGPPAVGKSAILDDLWPRRVPWDGGPLPAAWSGAYTTAMGLAALGLEPDTSRGLIETTFRKMATVGRLVGDGVYVQAGLAQIGLELGWRLGERAAADYYRIMPVSVGVVFMMADAETIEARNVARARNFAERVRPMLAACMIGTEVLRARWVRVIDVDTRRPIEENRATLAALAA